MSKITALKEHQSGTKDGKFGQYTWYRLGIQLDGEDKWYNGFVKDFELKKLGVQYPSELRDKEFDIKTYQEEYNGQMQDKFELNTPKGAGGAKLAEMAIKSHIDTKIDALRHDLKIIADHLGVEAPKSTIGNTSQSYPEPDISNDPEAVPF